MPAATKSRSLFRSFVHHIAEAKQHSASPNPVTMRAYPPQYRIMLGKAARATMFFLPGYAILLGWPLLPPLLFNGHMYGLGREPFVKINPSTLGAEGSGGRFTRGADVRGY